MVCPLTTGRGGHAEVTERNRVEEWTLNTPRFPNVTKCVPQRLTQANQLPGGVVDAMTTPVTISKRKPPTTTRLHPGLKLWSLTTGTITSKVRPAKHTQRVLG